MQQSVSPAALERFAWLAGSLVVIGLISWIDAETGDDIGLSVFYFAPIVIAGWFSGSASALLTSVTSATAWVLCERLHWHEHTLLGTALNGTFRLVGFSVAGLAVSRLRLDRAHLATLNAQLAELLDRESRQARTDVLTGLANLRSFQETLLTEIARDQREQRPLCLLYLDLDNFKKVNDKYGHDKGDEVLREVGSLMRRLLRAADVPARLGGDEFAALLWNTEISEGKFIAERLVEAISRLGAAYDGAELGASVGVVVFNNPAAIPEDMLKEVDALMYQAKREGKSRVITAERGKRNTAPSPD